MGDDRFDTNFTWYEWSFVSPEQVPTDDLQIRAGSTEQDGSPFSWPREVWSEDRRWTT